MGFCHFEKVKLRPSHSLATKGAVLAVGAFTFCVGLAWLARCVLPPVATQDIHAHVHARGPSASYTAIHTAVALLGAINIFHVHISTWEGDLT